MSFIEKIKEKAKSNIKTIVLPEGEEIRTLKAAEIINKEKFAKVVLVGNQEKIKEILEKENINIGDIQVIEPEKSEKKEEYANALYELRKAKGMTLEDAEKLTLDPVYFGMMMVKLEEADGLVSGAVHSTADTLRPALQKVLKH